MLRHLPAVLRVTSPVPASPDPRARFTASFDAVFASVGVKAIRTPIALPRANAFTERFVRTVREDGSTTSSSSRVDIEATLTEYFRYCHEGANPSRPRAHKPPAL